MLGCVRVGRPGSGFVTLAATLAAFARIPIEGLALLVGVDRFLSEARAIPNLIGNTVATVAIARWDVALDVDRAGRVLDGERVQEFEEAEAKAVHRVGARASA